MDPLAEDYPGWSPYNYTLQNPVKLVDPTGMSVEESGYGCPPNCNGYEEKALQFANIFYKESPGSSDVETMDTEHLPSVLVIGEGQSQNKEPDGVRIWNDIEGAGSGENMGIHTGKNGVSVNASELTGLGGNSAGAGFQSSLTKMLGVIASIMEPMSDLFGADKTSTKQNQNTPELSNERKVQDLNKNITMKIFAYSFYSYGPSGKSANSGYKDTIVTRKDSSKVVDLNVARKKEFKNKKKQFFNNH